MTSKIVRLGLIVAVWVGLSSLLFLTAHFYLLSSVLPGVPPPSYDAATNMIGWVGSTFLGALLFGSLMVFRLHGRVRRRAFGYGISRVVTFAKRAPRNRLRRADEFGVHRRNGSLGASRGRHTIRTTRQRQVRARGPRQHADRSLRQAQGRGQDLHVPRCDFVDCACRAAWHSRYFEFIREFVADVTDPILKYRGEIYQYVGDEIVVTWRPTDPDRNADCIRCFFAIRDRLDELEQKYESEFGVTPQFKAGIHLGPVTVGEIGVIRRDIVYSGDVLNTTSRIQGECNRRSERLLASRSLLDVIRLGPGLAWARSSSGGGKSG